MAFTLRLAMICGWALCVLTLPYAWADEECVSYAPDAWTLRGKLERHVFPGAPGFEDLATGDEPEVGFYLALESPLCVAGNDNEEALALDENVRLVQLVLNQQGYNELRPYLNQIVTLSGTFFSAISGHHHSPVLMQQVAFVEGTPAPPVDCGLLEKNTAQDNGGYRPVLQGIVTGTEKVWFHEAPGRACSAQRASVGVGDSLTVSSVTDDGWVYASHMEKDGTLVSGWLDQGQVVLNACPSCTQPQEAVAPDVTDYLGFVNTCTDDPTFAGCNELELMWHQLQEKYRNNQPMLALLGETWPHL